ncbi:hypothetical protein GCM10023149_01260 [Mucilaginibacter gynuensis]|uniref:WD40 repeat protein n=1 Tax=Mucilaginibacter gynuensis TaxID=1302236 RepID=A0ABP8FN80_9SPHI
MLKLSYTCLFSKNAPGALLLTCILISLSTQSRAQQFGGNPPSVEWKQVDSKAARVIFPAGMDSVGLRVANIINQMDKVIEPTIGNKHRQVSILLQNQTTTTNGYVGLAPFRSEFYLTPQQNSFELGSIHWPELLSIHEFRHVQQYNNFNVGLSRVLRIFFGDGGQALGNELSVPNWFYEGDAVFNETHVSSQGRGRLPYFFNSYRALWQADRNYSWMKLRNGSYIDYIPDHYPMGYMLVAYGREKYGADFWRKVTHDAAAYKGLFYPFQKAVKRYSGVSYAQFRTDALNYFKQQFPAQTIAPLAKGHFVANQEFPVYADDSTLIYLKSSYDHIPAFVIKKGEQEKKITSRGLVADDYFDYSNGKIVYSGYRPDARWGYRNYSEIRVLDIATGKEKNITSRSKYFSPSFSADGSKIVAVDVATSGKSELHIVNTADGKRIANIPNSKNLFYTYPKFYKESSIITAVRTPEGKMTIAQVDVKTGESKYLLSLSYQPIGYLTIRGDTVYFSATTGSNDNLYALSISDQKLFSVKLPGGDTNIGHYQAAVSNNKITWVHFTVNGFRLNETDKGNTKLTELADKALPVGLSNFNISALQKDSATNLLASVADKPLPVKNYNKAYNLFNFHSLIPDISDPNYRIALRGENVLNTFQSELSFNYNNNEGYKQFGFDAVYGALYPYISAGADYIIDRRRYYRGNNVYWTETDLHGGLQIPFNFSGGKQITGLSIGSDIYFTNTSYRNGYGNLDRRYAYLNNYINFSTHIQQARKNLFPRFGQSFSFIYKSAINLNANQFLALGTFYFPGLSANHNLIVTAAHQEKGQNNVIGFSNNFAFSRGYEAENLYKMNKVGVNYHFPIAYPDAGVANTVYLLRLRGNVFYEYTHASDFYVDGSKFKANFRSVGGAVFFDTKFFNQESISFGIRYSHLLDRDLFGGSGSNRIELVLPVSIF